VVAYLKSVAIGEPPSRITSTRSMIQETNASGGESIPSNQPNGSKQNPM